METAPLPAHSASIHPTTREEATTGWQKWRNRSDWTNLPGATLRQLQGRSPEVRSDPARRFNPLAARFCCNKSNRM